MSVYKIKYIAIYASVTVLRTIMCEEVYDHKLIWNMEFYFGWIYYIALLRLDGHDQHAILFHGLSCKCFKNVILQWQ